MNIIFRFPYKPYSYNCSCFDLIGHFLSIQLKTKKKMFAK